ncbi:MAG TPA: hypothetical protein VFB22_17185 [Candidatus Baltobacteraceae bacterium]|nr:hypothetical protein [Candidatus Baltobacteraceae bacterium]
MRSAYPVRLTWLAIAVAAFALAAGRPAEAIPVFAHRYGLTCQTCHTVVPHLTAFGRTFLANGYRIRGLAPKPAFPVAVRIEADYASAGAADPDEIRGPLPKTIVDEVEFLLGGSAGPRFSYWAEVYAVDGGFPGNSRDIWGAYRATPDGAPTPVVVRAGQFTLPLPLDPETFRETTQPYAIWSQTAGINPFNFFTPKIGAQVAAGDPARALAGTVSFLNGHDQASGLPSHGVDTMVTLERDLGDFSLSAYRYDGSRELAGLGYNDTQFFTGIADRFWRDGYGLGWARGATEINAVYQIGSDSAADVYGDSLTSSGGFLQVRQAFGNRAFAIARWDATRDAGFARTITAGGGYRLTRNTRLTLFETGERDYLGRLLHVVSSSFLVAF